VSSTVSLGITITYKVVILTTRRLSSASVSSDSDNGDRRTVETAVEDTISNPVSLYSQDLHFGIDGTKDDSQEPEEKTEKWVTLSL